jgi:hypothetical protein
VLWLQSTKIRDIKPLEKLTNLTKLDLEDILGKKEALILSEDQVNRINNSEELNAIFGEGGSNIGEIQKIHSTMRDRLHRGYTKTNALQEAYGMKSIGSRLDGFLRKLNSNFDELKDKTDTERDALVDLISVPDMRDSSTLHTKFKMSDYTFLPKFGVNLKLYMLGAMQNQATAHAKEITSFYVKARDTKDFADTYNNLQQNINMYGLDKKPIKNELVQRLMNELSNAKYSPNANPIPDFFKMMFVEYIPIFCCLLFFEVFS